MSSSSFTARVDAAYEKYKDADVDALMRAIGAEDPETDPHPLAVWALQQAGKLMRVHAAEQIAKGQTEFEYRDMRVFVSSVLLMGVIVGKALDNEEHADEDDGSIEPGVMNRLVLQIATETNGDEMTHEQMTEHLATFGLDFMTQADMSGRMGAQFLAGVTMGVKAVFAWLDGDNPA